jgi:hypothetical protein
MLLVLLLVVVGIYVCIENKVPVSVVIYTTLIVASVVLAIALWHEHRVSLGYRELALTVSSVTSVTIYDVSGFATEITSNKLSSAVSAQFPVEVFTTAAASAEYHYQPQMWKVAYLAILTLRDGSHRRAKFDTIWGMFALEGTPGTYIVEHGGGSEFGVTLNSIIQKQFVPKRNDQDKPSK